MPKDRSARDGFGPGPLRSMFFEVFFSYIKSVPKSNPILVFFLLMFVLGFFLLFLFFVLLVLACLLLFWTLALSYLILFCFFPSVVWNNLRPLVLLGGGSWALRNPMWSPYNACWRMWHGGWGENLWRSRLTLVFHVFHHGMLGNLIWVLRMIKALLSLLEGVPDQKNCIMHVGIKPFAFMTHDTIFYFALSPQLSTKAGVW